MRWNGTFIIPSHIDCEVIYNMANYTLATLPSKFAIGDTVTFNYTGAIQNFPLLNQRDIKVECWGAVSGLGGYYDLDSGFILSGTPGLGNYLSAATIQNENLKVYVGGKGGNAYPVYETLVYDDGRNNFSDVRYGNGGWSDGGIGTLNNDNTYTDGGGGGGSSSVRSQNETSLKIMAKGGSADRIWGWLLYGGAGGGSQQYVGATLISQTGSNSGNGKVVITILSLRTFYLLQSGSTIKTWNGTDFANVGSIPVTDAMFTSNGFFSTTGLTKDKLTSLYSPKLLVKKGDSNTVSTKFTGTPLPKLILAGSDIQLSTNISNLDKFTLTANVLNTANLRIITSTDSGTTWQAYNTATSNWVTVDKNDLTSVKTKGNTVAEFNALDANVWNAKVLNSTKKVRFGYYLEVNATTDTIETDLLTMQADANGKWKACSNGVEFTYSYSDDDVLAIKLLASGDFRMTVI